MIPAAACWRQPKTWFVNFLIINKVKVNSKRKCGAVKFGKGIVYVLPWGSTNKDQVSSGLGLDI